MSGSDHLSIDLQVQLAAGGTAHKIPSGNIRAVDLRLWSYGLEGSVEFGVEDRSNDGGKADEVLADFLKPDLMSVSLSVHSLHPDVKVSDSRQPLALKGLVSAKSLSTVTYDAVSKTPVLLRIYRLEFMDPARLLWGQHHPCELYTNKAMKDVLDAHKGNQITLNCSWDVLTKQVPMIFVGLDPFQGKASFYDLVMWFVDTRNGVFSYDYASNGYNLASEKDSSGKAVQLFMEDVQHFSAEFPAVPRHQTAILNSWTEGTSNTATSQQQAATGIRQDVLMRTSIAKDASDRHTLEANRLKLSEQRIVVELKRFPALPLVPGTLVDLPETAFWTNPAGKSGANKGLRIYEMTLKARTMAEDAGTGFDAPDAPFSVEGTLRIEMKDEKIVPLPAYTAPTPSLIVEGKIVSEAGQDADLTYQIYTDSQTNLDNYKVKIPLWSNQEITTGYEPNLFPGHFYFPAYKGQRVLVALGFQSAAIRGFLDWRDGARLPADGQGDQLLLGKSTKSNTSLQHYYDSDKPVFRVLRTNDKDTGSIRIQEGQLVIKVQESSGS